jgi:hypothetical protein
VFVLRSCCCVVFCVGEAKWAELGGGFIGASTAGNDQLGHGVVVSVAFCGFTVGGFTGIQITV